MVAMKLALISLLLTASPALAATAKSAKAPAPKEAYKTDDERSIYTIGFLMGRNVAAFNLSPAEVKVIQAGLGDAVLGKQPQVDVRFYQPRVNELLTKRMEAAASKEKAKGRAYTEKFVKEMKPQAIPGGGWYLPITEGAGAAPSKTDKVRTHYRGTTVDGEEFDSSYSRGAPSEFKLNGVIQCWTNGITMMKVGGKAKLVCPSDVAYGDPGRQGIKPGATLVFEVELLDIVKE